MPSRSSAPTGDSEILMSPAVGCSEPYAAYANVPAPWDTPPRVRTCELVPKIGRAVPADWRSSLIEYSFRGNVHGVNGGH